MPPHARFTQSPSPRRAIRCSRARPSEPRDCTPAPCVFALQSQTTASEHGRRRSSGRSAAHPHRPLAASGYARLLHPSSLLGHTAHVVSKARHQRVSQQATAPSRPAVTTWRAGDPSRAFARQLLLTTAGELEKSETPLGVLGVSAQRLSVDFPALDGCSICPTSSPTNQPPPLKAGALPGAARRQP
jgi:hypothetical protein